MMFKQLHTHKPQLHPVVSLKVSVFDDHQQVRLNSVHKINEYDNVKRAEHRAEQA